MKPFRYIRYLAVLAAAAAMVAAAEISGNLEVIFPEVLALLLGAWASDRMPWRVGRIQFVAIMTAAAVGGVLLVRYLRFPFMGDATGGVSIWIRMVLGFLLIAVILRIARSTLLPAISACMLPVLMSTETWVYPIAVAIMAAVIMAGLSVMERWNLRPKEDSWPTPLPAYDPVSQRRLWLLGLAPMMLLAAAALGSGFRFAAAPPLMVVLVTFLGNRNLASGRQAVKFYIVIIYCAVVGAACRLLLSEWLGLSYILCALIATAAVLLFCELTGVFLPPAGALALLPLLIPREALISYPLQVAAGAAFVIAAGCLLSKYVESGRLGTESDAGKSDADIRSASA